MSKKTESEFILTDLELRNLTEFVHRAKQRARLVELGIPFVPGRFGRPIVLRAVVEQRLGGNAVGERHRTVIEPDFDALAELQNGS